MNKLKEKLNKFLKTGFFHVFGGSVINKVVGFLSSVVLVRILTKEEYGVFTYAWNIYSIILLANGLGMESAVLQLCSERSGDENLAKRACNYGSRFGIKFDLLIAVVLFAVGTFVKFPVDGAGQLLQMLCILPVFKLMFGLTTAYLRSQKRNQNFAKINVINTVAVFVVSAGGAYLFREKGMVLGYYIAYFLTVILGFLWMRVRLVSKCEPLGKEDRKAMRSIGFVSMCNTGLSQLMHLLGIFVLGIVDPQETILASYRVATIIPTALSFVPHALITYLYPYFAQNRNNGKWCLKHYKQAVLGLGAVNLLISGGLCLFAPLIIKLMFGEEYMDALPVFRLLSANYFISGTFRVFSGNLLVTQRKLKFNLVVAIVSSGLNIVADFLFVTWWGSMGAALATVLVVIITSVANTVYLIYTFKQNSKSVEQNEIQDGGI